MTGRVSADCFLNDMSRVVQDHTKEKDPSTSRVSSQSDVFSCVHVHMHVLLRPDLVVYMRGHC